MTMADTAVSSAVPLAAAELRSLLQEQSADGPLSDLFAIQRALSTGGPGLHGVNADVLKAAIARMDQMGCRSPGLGLLRLKIARQIASNDAHAQAERLPSEVKWMPVEAAASSAQSSGHSTLGLHSGFPDTVSTTGSTERGS